MFSIPLILLLTLIMATVQIAIFKSFPHFLRTFLASALLLGVFVNFMLSGIIMVFTAAGFLAGISNLAGSVFFGIYLEAYRRRHGITHIQCEWMPIMCTLRYWFFGKRSWTFRLPCFRRPRIWVPEARPFEHWFW